MPGSFPLSVMPAALLCSLPSYSSCHETAKFRGSGASTWLALGPFSQGGSPVYMVQFVDFCLDFWLLIIKGELPGPVISRLDNFFMSNFLGQLTVIILIVYICNKFNELVLAVNRSLHSVAFSSFLPFSLDRVPLCYFDWCLTLGFKNVILLTQPKKYLGLWICSCT